MKKVNFSALDLDPETISNLTDEQADEIQGGVLGGLSCRDNSCNTKAAAVASEVED
jgi:hypothetical protein